MFPPLEKMWRWTTDWTGDAALMSSSDRAGPSGYFGNGRQIQSQVHICVIYFPLVN